MKVRKFLKPKLSFSGKNYYEEYDWVISCIGTLHRPIIPQLVNQSIFYGEMFHTAHWPRDFDPTGKRIGIIGSGATAVQVLPQIVYSEARRVTLFQRTPNYVIKKANPKFGPYARFIFSFDVIQSLVRFISWIAFDNIWWFITFKPLVKLNFIAKQNAKYLSVVKEAEVR